MNGPPIAEWLAHPAVQSGLAPFIVALLVTELFLRLRLSGLAIAAGFAVTFYLAADFALLPPTAARKAALAVLLAAPLGIVLDLLPKKWGPPLAGLAAGAAALWMLWTALAQQELRQALTAGAGAVAFVVWLAVAADRLRERSVAAGALAFGLGAGAGGVALLGASALLGQFGLAAGAAGGAYLLIQMLGGKPLPCGRVFTLCLAVLCGLAAAGAAVLAKAPWPSLGLLALIPLAAWIPLPPRFPVWGQAILSGALTGLPAAAAIAWALRQGGGLPV